MDAIELVRMCQAAVPYAVEQRRFFHRHPEPTSKEFETIKHICDELDKMGISYVNIPDGGILAEINGKEASEKETGGEKLPHVLLRADCDALTMEENRENANVPRICISENQGVAHMCGHDGHMAMLLGAAKVLSQIKPEAVKGKIYLLFERGEEGGNCIYYVMKYIQEQQIRIDSCYALHVDPNIPVGKFWMEEGPSYAGNVNFEIGLTGKGGHGSRPDLSNNPLDCFVSIMNQLKDVRLKYISPKELITYNIGSVQCGHKRNIVPEFLEFKGTARFYHTEAGKIFKEKLDAIIKTNAMLYSCQPEYFVFSGPSLSLINNGDAAKLAREAAIELFGADCLVQRERDLGSESFSTLAAYYPSIMARLGVRNEKKGMTAALHNPRFDLDEEALQYGIASHVAYALKYLEVNPTIKFTPFNGNADDVLKFTCRPVPKRYDNQG